MNAITNGVTITIEGTDVSYHSLRDWGLAIGNNNPVGDVKPETFFLDVPGADGFLDYSEALTGRPVFKERSVSVTLGGQMERSAWTAFVSRVRNLLHGKTVRLVFDDFPGYYWLGRCEISGFDRSREVGSFTLSLPKADPYGYCVNDNSTPDWLWDPFDLEDGVIDEPVNLILDAEHPTASCTITHGNIPFLAAVRVTSVGPLGLTMTVNGDTYLLRTGENRSAALVVDKEDLTLDFSGEGTLSVVYRRRTL